MKRIICGLLAASMFFCGGMYFGLNSSTPVVSFATEESTSTVIAVVNLDEGIENSDGDMNFYSNTFINMLGTGYVVESASGAASGLKDGRYGAVITFPSNTSECIESLNSVTPVTLDIIYAINQNLDKESYLDVFSVIENFKSEINDSISYLYVVSILEGLHTAQDNIDTLYANNDAVLSSLENVTSLNYIERLNMSMMPETSLNLDELSSDEYYNRAVAISNQVNGIYAEAYTNSYNDISSQLETLKSQIDSFRNWNSDADRYNAEVYGSFQDFERNLSTYYSHLVTYKDLVISYTDVIVNNNDYVGAYNLRNLSFANDMNDWKNAIIAYRDQLNLFASNLISCYDDLAQSYIELCDYRTDLDTWKSDLDAYRSELSDWATEYRSSVDRAYSTLQYMPEFASYNEFWMNIYIVFQKYESSIAADSSYTPEIAASEIYTIIDSFYSQLFGNGAAFYGYDFSNQQFNGHLQNSNEGVSRITDFVNSYENPNPSIDIDLPEYEGCVPTTFPVNPSDIYNPNSYNYNEHYCYEENPSLNFYDSSISDYIVDMSNYTVNISGNYSDLGSLTSFSEEMPTYDVSFDRPSNPADIEGYVNSIDSFVNSLNPSMHVLNAESRYATQLNHVLGQYLMLNNNMALDFNSNQASNAAQLHETYNTYRSYVSTMRGELTDTYNDENTLLEETVNNYSNEVNDLNNCNRELLGEFSSILPNSRQGRDVNTQVVDAIIAPVEFSDVSDSPSVILDVADPTPNKANGFKYAAIASAAGVAIMGLVLIVDAVTKKRRA